MRLKLALLLVAASLVVGIGWSSFSYAAEGCHDFYNSSRTFFFGYGWACAGTGGTCRECYSTGEGGSYSVCVGEIGKTPICYDYQNW
jgi:hypothetical protein